MCSACGQTCSVCDQLSDAMVLTSNGWVLTCALHFDDVIATVTHQELSRANAWLN